MRYLTLILLVVLLTIPSIGFSQLVDIDVNQNQTFTVPSGALEMAGRLNATRNGNTDPNHTCTGYVAGTSLNITAYAQNHDPYEAVQKQQIVTASSGTKHAYCTDWWPGELDDSYVGWNRNTIRFRIWLGI